MFISKSLAKKLRHPASVLLRDGVDKDGIPKIVVRQVNQHGANSSRPVVKAESVSPPYPTVLPKPSMQAC